MVFPRLPCSGKQTQDIVLTLRIKGVVLKKQLSRKWTETVDRKDQPPPFVSFF